MNVPAIFILLDELEEGGGGELGASMQQKYERPSHFHTFYGPKGLGRVALPLLELIWST